jgi:hypothetical protein
VGKTTRSNNNATVELTVILRLTIDLKVERRWIHQFTKARGLLCTTTINHCPIVSVPQEQAQQD